MAHHLAVDRKWKGPREKVPASTRLPWRIKTNRYDLFIEFLSLCVHVRATWNAWWLE